MSNELISKGQTDYNAVMEIFNQLESLETAPIADTKSYLEMQVGESKRVMFFGTGQLPNEEGVMIDAAIFLSTEKELIYSMAKVLVSVCIENNYQKTQPLLIERLEDGKNGAKQSFHRWKVSKLIVPAKK
jgi:hypothetical protein